MEAALTDLYDPALLGILQHVGNVEQFLRVLFGFLYRKTDFYRLLLRPGDRLGFPPGAARAMALQAFQVFEQMARQDDEKRRQELEAKLRKKEEEEEAAAAAERMHLSSAVQEVEVETTAEYDTAPAAEGAAGPPESAGAQDTGPSPALAEPSAATASAEPPPAARPAKQEQFQTDPDSYNGAVRENYAWSQDYSDLEIKVPVPKHIVKGKQVSVDISSSTIRVAVLEGSSQHVLMEGKLTHKINTESCLWSLEPGKCILVRTACTSCVSMLWLPAPPGSTWKTGAAGSLSQINLNKGDEYWWNAILEGEEQIDIDKINKERSMATVDEEEHAVLDRLTFDYHQKLQGKPQSHELKVHEMLKKGWDTEGSPFRGQKFDPSMFNISPGAVQF
ncbi:nudC domain-containing protein 3 isoform X1 [Cuculus canorus]|uniref:nudC domain-containing protein 3 isoform X1 n=1 Tax=Cuculus canorus TaxID=55661 RepID=UPI0023AA64AE|nr:nudC domain-containing protein 3 isoform X1 [Cuculus canorus]